MLHSVHERPRELIYGCEEKVVLQGAAALGSDPSRPRHQLGYPGTFLKLSEPCFFDGRRAMESRVSRLQSMSGVNHTLQGCTVSTGLGCQL